MRQELLTDKLNELFEDASGIEIGSASTSTNFLEIGFDSLLLTQIATNLKKEFNVPITFRKLFEEYNTIQLLAAYLDANLPAGAYAPPAAAPVNHYQQPVYSAPAAPCLLYTSYPGSKRNLNPLLGLIRYNLPHLVSTYPSRKYLPL